MSTDVDVHLNPTSSGGRESESPHPAAMDIHDTDGCVMRTADAAATQAKMKMKTKMEAETVSATVCLFLLAHWAWVRTSDFYSGFGAPRACRASHEKPASTSEHAIIPRGITIIIRP